MKKLITAGAVLALVVPSVALAAASLKVSPNSVKAGGVLTVSGSVPKACKKGSHVTLESLAFKGGIPFNGKTFKFGKVSTKVKTGGKFSVKTTIPNNRKAARYYVRGRCSTGNFGGVKFFLVT